MRQAVSRTQMWVRARMPVYGLNSTLGLVPYMGDKGDKSAAHPPEGSLVETRCLIKGPMFAIVPFPEPRSGPKSRTGPGASQKAKSRYLSYAPPAYEYGTRPFLRWVLSQGRSPRRQAVPKMPRTPSAFLFSGRLRRRAINPTPPKRVKAWGDGPLRPEVMYPVVEHTRTNSAASNHSRSRAPHHRTQSKRRASQKPYICRCLPPDTT